MGQVKVNDLIALYSSKTDLDFEQENRSLVVVDAKRLIKIKFLRKKANGDFFMDLGSLTGEGLTENESIMYIDEANGVRGRGRCSARRTPSKIIIEGFYDFVDGNNTNRIPFRLEYDYNFKITGTK